MKSVRDFFREPSGKPAVVWSYFPHVIYRRKVTGMRRLDANTDEGFVTIKGNRFRVVRHRPFHWEVVHEGGSP
jgi:hypothetical protein